MKSPSRETFRDQHDCLGRHCAAVYGQHIRYGRGTFEPDIVPVSIRAQRFHRTRRTVGGRNISRPNREYHHRVRRCHGIGDGGEECRFRFHQRELPGFPIPRQVEEQLDRLCLAALDEQFEVGVESRLSRELQHLCAYHPIAVLRSLRRRLIHGGASPEVLSEILQWASRQEAGAIRSIVVELLSMGLHHMSSLVRDAAASARSRGGDRGRASRHRARRSCTPGCRPDRPARLPSRRGSFPAAGCSASAHSSESRARVTRVMRFPSLWTAKRPSPFSPSGRRRCLGVLRSGSRCLWR